jgi:hypothetical protein
MRPPSLRSLALSSLMLAGWSNASAELVTVTFRDLHYQGAGYSIIDPPPAGFEEALSGAGSSWAWFVYDDTALSPIGPTTESPLGFRFDALRSVVVGLGNNVFETHFPAEAPGAITTYRYAGQSLSWWGAGGPASSGPTVFGLSPFNVDVSGAYEATPDQFPLPSTFRNLYWTAGVAFLTPRGNIVNVSFGPERPIASPVPEPASALLLGAGIVVLGGRLRRSRDEDAAARH